jgi:hypothetical protein
MMPVTDINVPPRKRPQYSNFARKSNFPTLGAGARPRK